jgi:hypothetical protein
VHFGEGVLRLSVESAPMGCDAPHVSVSCVHSAVNVQNRSPLHTANLVVNPRCGITALCVFCAQTAAKTGQMAPMTRGLF